MDKAEYRYDPAEAKGIRVGMICLLGFFVALFVVVGALMSTMPGGVSINFAVFGILVGLSLIAMPVVGIVLTNRRIAHRGVVLGLDDHGLRYSPFGRVPHVIPWSRIVRVRRQAAQGNVSVGVEYFDAQGRERDRVIGLSQLDCANAASLAILIMEQADRFASTRPPLIPRSRRRAAAVRRGLFWFSMVTWVLPCGIGLAETLAARWSDRPSNSAGPLTQLLRSSEFAPVVMTLMCLGCLAMIFWAWLVARGAAERAEERGGKLSTAARWVAGLCSVAAIGAATFIWWQEGNRLNTDLWKFMAYAYGGGLMGIVYCVWVGRNPDAPDLG